MKIEAIEKALKNLAMKSDFYKRIYEGLCMYKDCDTYSYNYFVNDLEAQNFMNVSELKQYLEAIYLDP